MDYSAISALLAPRSVAVIGASSDPARIGGRPIATMLAAGFQGRILPVNPTRDTIQGLPCYPSVSALPETPDAALIAVAARDVAGVVEDLGRLGCKTATLFSSGFAEVDETGRQEQDRILDIARGYGMRILGPNTLGVFNVNHRYFGTFSSSLEGGLPLPGNIGIASQSGAFGAHLAVIARNRGLGASVLIATGNEADITVGEAIGWMAESDEIDVICAYLEGINSPRSLLEGLEAARAARKPVIVFKAGRSAIGAHAAASHTASLTGDALVADTILRAHGAILVRDSEQLMDVAYVARQRIQPRSATLGFVTVSGGAGIVASDEAEAIGFAMPPMPADVQAELKALMPISTPTNPLDCTAQALNQPDLFEQFTRAALDRGGYGAVICFMTYVAGSPSLAPTILKSMAPLRKDFPDRLIVICGIGPDEIMGDYEKAGFLVFADPSRAVRALHAVAGLDAVFTSPRPAAPAPLIVPALPDNTPDEVEAKRLLTGVGIAIAPERAATTVEEAVVAANEIGYPVVLKILSPGILHKSDIGGVKLNIRDPEAVRGAHAEIMAAAAARAPDARITGILVARQMTGGVECFMGINRDPTFGPVAVFGLGGIFVEILNDVAVRQCPFGEAAAREMILSIRASAILEGARGRPPADVAALAAMLSCLSRFAMAAGPELRSVDLNPVLALPQGQGAFALDAVVEIAGPAQGGH